MSIQVTSNEKPSTPSPQDSKVEGESADLTSSAPAEKAEQNESGNSETQETEAKESDSDSKESEPVENDEPENKEGQEGKPHKKGNIGTQRRINEITRDKYAALARAERAEAELAQMRSSSQPTERKVEPAKPATDDGKPVRPKIDAFPTFEAYEAARDEYVDKMTDWKTDQKLKERDHKTERSRLETEQAKAVTTYQQKAKAFLESHPDFDEVVAGIPVSPTVVGIIQSSEHGPEIAYELGKNPEEAKRIAMLPPIQAAVEMGAIKSRIASKASGEKKPETKRVSSAPDPIAPVGGSGGKTSQPKTLEEAAKHSQAEYNRLREEQLKKQRRRA